MKEKEERKQEEAVLQVIRLRFLRILVLNKKKWGHLKPFRCVSKIIHPYKETLYLSQIGISKNDLKDIFTFLEEKNIFTFTDECKETMETVSDFMAGVYITREKRHESLLL